MTPPVTIDHVARRAGVSPKTVSRVVNAEPNVRESTRALVQHAIAELGYRPNLAARSLAASRSFLIGLISIRLDAHVFRSMHGAGIRACQARGFHLVAEEIGGIDSRSLQELEQRLQQMRFDGVIVSQLADRVELLDLLERLHIPYVRMAPTVDLERSDAVRSDMVQGLKMLAEHLWALGHRHIAVAAPDAWRYRIIRRELIQLGCDPARVVPVKVNWRNSPMDSGLELAKAVLSMRELPTAVYAYNDEMAAAFIHYAWAHGIKVPQDISVAGFDNAEIASIVWPPITTVQQPFDEMVRAAVTLLAEPEERARDVVFPVQLIARASTAPPAIRTS